ncbi:hypothetical protein CF138_17250 [Aeromonas hydrophila]|uniref:hypothetical protein n=1 Tax=Aeromonas hydrophila TaxID=644 RepID=UPI001115C512|nr:hypothetical protein [Aeromonas hydrophila]TNH82847.1 hypothetical protein CF138_17250 [Aeromonas hydrophila]TNI00232.1 hypothetical protein CF136_10555 [Aeromonas hydrophila]TNI92887.1 hypothetical protein CF118_18085 [Aeromonas hydrophila]
MKVYLEVEIDDGYTCQEPGMLMGCALELLKEAMKREADINGAFDVNTYPNSMVHTSYLLLNSGLDGHGEGGGVAFVPQYDLSPKSQRLAGKIFN